MIEKNMPFRIKPITRFKTWKWNGEYPLVVLKAFTTDSWL